MKKILVCAALATVLAFSVGGCNKQEEPKEKEVVSEKTDSMLHDTAKNAEEMMDGANTATENASQDAAGVMSEKKEAMTDEAKEMMDKSNDAGSQMMDQTKE